VEKVHEIAKMGEIYSNSALNLSAASAESSSDGLVFDRQLLSVTPCRLPIPNAATEISTQALFAYTFRFVHEVDLGSLQYRGWIFQERLLAPRTLHFSRDQIFWECVSTRAAENLPDGDRALGSAYGENFRTWYLEDASKGLMTRRKAREIWAMLVSAYSQTSLTYPRDRLVAFSGVARKYRAFAGFRDDEYVAGLWRPDLAWQLLWDVVAPWENNDESTPYRAPSWSWASPSAQGVVWLLHTTGDINVDIETAIVYLESSDTFGGVAGGYIRIKGPMCKLFRQGPWRGDASIFQAGEIIISRDSIRTSWDAVPDDFDESSRLAQVQGIAPEKLYLMPFLLHSQDQDPHDGSLKDTGLRGLILDPVSGMKGYYRRLGTFSISDKAAGLPNFRSVFSTKTLKDIDYLEFDSVDTYTIIVI
jgi:hypothetical protein